MTTTLMTILFWTGFFLIFYTYIGYGFVIGFLSWIKGPFKVPPVQPADQLPEVTVVIAAYNEEQVIEQKINNTLALDYPKEKLSVFIVTDGSTDHTPQIVKKFHAVKLFHEPVRKGKIHAVNRVMKFVTTPIVIFTDANTVLNSAAIMNMVRHYQDARVGGVAGEKRIFRQAQDNATGSGEGFYWRYESFLKKKDSEVNSIVGAAGELFSIRTALFEAPDEEAIIEDFILSVGIAARGYRFVYEPAAYAMETASVSVSEEWKRKVRICAGGFQAIARLRNVLNPFKHRLLSFQYISHRVLRWTLTPFFLPVIFFANLALSLEGPLIYVLLMAAQSGFYALAIAGFFFRNKKVSVRGFFIPYYFLVMNLSVYAGFKRYIMGQQSVVWDKARRATISPESVNT